MVNNQGKRRRIRKQQINKGIVTIQLTENNVYPIIDKITKTQGITSYYSIETMVDYHKPKVVFSNSGYPLATWIDFPTNLSDNLTYYVPETELEGRNLIKIINSKIFGEVIQLFSTNARDAHRTIKRLRRVDLSKCVLNDENDIKRLFGYL